MTAPNLPGTRPTSDNYSADLVNDRPVKQPTRELDANAWNLLKADVAYMGQVTSLAKAYVPNAGSVSLVTVVAFGVAPTSVVRNGAGDVTVTYPTTVRIFWADACPNTDGVYNCLALFTPGSNTVRVKSNGVDCNFSLEVS